MLQFILRPGSSLSAAGMLHENNTPTGPHMLTVAPRELPDGYHLSLLAELFSIALQAFTYRMFELFRDFECRHVFGLHRHLLACSRVPCLTKIFMPDIE